MTFKNNTPFCCRLNGYWLCCERTKAPKKSFFFTAGTRCCTAGRLFRCFCRYITIVFFPPSNDTSFVLYCSFLYILVYVVVCCYDVGKEKEPWHQCQPLFTVRTTTTDLTRHGCSKVLHLCNHTLQSFLDRSALSNLLPRATSLIAMWSDCSSCSIEHC